jgi:hypothetical protein
LALSDQSAACVDKDLAVSLDSDIQLLELVGVDDIADGLEVCNLVRRALEQLPEIQH